MARYTDIRNDPAWQQYLNSMQGGLGRVNPVTKDTLVRDGSEPVNEAGRPYAQAQGNPDYVPSNAAWTPGTPEYDQQMRGQGLDPANQWRYDSMQRGMEDDLLPGLAAAFKTGAGEIWDDPQRIFTGIDPISTGISNAVLGQNKAPITTQFGSPSATTWENAQADRPDINFHQAQDFGRFSDMAAGTIGGAVAGGAIAGGGSAATAPASSSSFTGGLGSATAATGTSGATLAPVIVTGSSGGLAGAAGGALGGVAAAAPIASTAPTAPTSSTTLPAVTVTGTNGVGGGAGTAAGSLGAGLAANVGVGMVTNPPSGSTLEPVEVTGSMSDTAPNYSIPAAAGLTGATVGQVAQSTGNVGDGKGDGSFLDNFDWQQALGALAGGGGGGGQSGGGGGTSMGGRGGGSTAAPIIFNNQQPQGLGRVGQTLEPRTTPEQAQRKFALDQALAKSMMGFGQ